MRRIKISLEGNRARAKGTEAAPTPSLALRLVYVHAMTTPQHHPLGTTGYRSHGG